MIRIPILDVRAPWAVLFSAAIATVLMLAAGAAMATGALITRPPSWLRAWRMHRRVERAVRDADRWFQQAADLWSVAERRHFATLLASNDKRAGRP